MFFFRLFVEKRAENRYEPLRVEAQQQKKEYIAWSRLFVCHLRTLIRAAAAEGSKIMIER